METMTQLEYKLLGVNRFLRMPLILIIRTLVAGWVTAKYTGKAIGFIGRQLWRVICIIAAATAVAWNAVFNRRNAVRVRKTWRAYKQLISDTGDFVINLMFFRGKIGQVVLDLQDTDVPDGFIVARQFGEEQRMVEIAFRIENRWLVNGKELPSGYVLSQVRTQAMIAGYKVAYLKWGNKKLMPYQVAPLGLIRKPDDVMLPAEEKWTEEQQFPQYAGDLNARYGNIVQRA